MLKNDSFIFVFDFCHSSIVEADSILFCLYFLFNCIHSVSEIFILKFSKQVFQRNLGKHLCIYLDYSENIYIF